MLCVNNEQVKKKTPVRMLTIKSLSVGDLFRLVPGSSRVYIKVKPFSEGLLKGVPCAKLVSSSRVYTFNGNIPVYPVH